MMIAASECLRGIARFDKPVRDLGFVRYFLLVRTSKILSSSHEQFPLRRFMQSVRVKEGLIWDYGRRSFNICAVSLPIRVLTPLFSVLKYSTGAGKILSSDDIYNEDEVTDEALNKLLSALSTNPDAYKHIGSIYVEKLCKAGNYTSLAKLVHVLHENQVTLSRNVYNILLSAAGDANDGDLLFRMLKYMLVSDSLNSTSYFNCAKAFMKMSDSLSLVKFVKDVSELAPPTGVTFLNRIIYSLAGCGQMDKALLIYHNMKILMCKPDLVTYNTILGILGRTGRVDEMLVEFSCMKESSIVPDLVSFNTLINSLKKVGRLDLCLKLMKEMTESGLEPDLRTYTALIESFGRMGNVEEPVRLLEEMKVRGVRPSIYIYRSLIDSLKKAGKVEVAVKYLEEMKTNYEFLVGPKDFKRKSR